MVVGEGEGGGEKCKGGLEDPGRAWSTYPRNAGYIKTRSSVQMGHRLHFFIDPTTSVVLVIPRLADFETKYFPQQFLPTKNWEFFIFAA